MSIWNKIKSWGGPNPDFRMFTVMAVLACPLLVFAKWMAMNGSRWWVADLLAVTFYIFLVMIALVGIVVVPVLTWRRKAWRWGIKWIGSYLLMIAAVLAGMRTGVKFQEAGYERFVKESAPLVAALEKFTTEQGHPPATLAELVPKYLPAVPQPSIGIRSEYGYRSGGQALAENPWALQVSVPTMGIDIDQFHYFPKQNYAEKFPVGRMKFLDGWGILKDS